MYPKLFPYPMGMGRGYGLHLQATKGNGGSCPLIHAESRRAAGKRTLAFDWGFIVCVFTERSGDVRQVDRRLRLSSECLRRRTEPDASKRDFFPGGRYIVKALSGETSLKQEILP